MKVAATAAALLLLTTSAIAQDVVSGEGTAVRQWLAANSYLNDGSSLVRRWTVVNDPALPVSFNADHFRGIQVGLQDGAFEYFAQYTIDVTEPIAAIRVIFYTFDVFNNRVRFLSATDIKDIHEGPHEFRKVWTSVTEDEAKAHFATLGFVDQVRTLDGRVIRFDRAQIPDQYLVSGAATEQ